MVWPLGMDSTRRTPFRPLRIDNVFEFYGFRLRMKMLPLHRLMFTLRDGVRNLCFISCDCEFLVPLVNTLQIVEAAPIRLLLCSSVSIRSFVVEMLRNNFMSQRTRNLRKLLMNLIKSETPVCHDVLFCPVFKSSLMREERVDCSSS
jgi:hypothetical protein